jgi:lipoate-protein ligase A
MGADESLLESVAAGGAPVFRLYGWAPPAVSIGYFQRLNDVIDMDSCKSNGVDVVRRVSGGGAVFHQAELTYSILLPLSHPLAEGGIELSFERLCSGIVKGLSMLGVVSRFKPVNDIYAGQKKISGSAQIRRKHCLLQHGTVLLDAGAELMFKLLKLPPAAGKKDFTGRAQNRVTSLTEELGRPVSFDEAEKAIVEGFRLALDLEFENAGTRALSPAEETLAQALARDKFASSQWLTMR